MGPAIMPCVGKHDPRFIYAWPTAKIAVMSGDSAAKTLLQIQVASEKAKGKVVSAEDENKLLSKSKAVTRNKHLLTMRPHVYGWMQS